MKLQLGHERTLFIHLTLVPYLSSAGETKTKPTQHSVKEMLSHGLQPDLLICRSDSIMSDEDKEKIALFTNVQKKAVISMPNVDSIYKIPLELNLQNVDELVVEKLGIKCPSADLTDWEKVVEADLNPDGSVRIAMVGKYTELVDAYKSLNEALKHGGLQNQLKIDINYVDSETLNKNNVNDLLGGSHAVLVPGGFGERGIEGMILAAEYARVNKVPYLGICLGLQVAVIEFARNVLHLEDANSSEFKQDTKHPVIGLIHEWIDPEGAIEKRDVTSDLGGTMRLGSQECLLSGESITRSLYNQDTIYERHRHRYEVNNNYIDDLSSLGLNIVGKSKDKNLVEVIELEDHPWFVACQFHPEFTSNPREGHPLFSGFIKAAEEWK
jgi:CTP synthase